MEINPAIRTPREDARTNSSSGNAYREMPYADYLQTPHWFKTRDRALRRAGWTCMRCPAQRALQVHHKTYERLGEELDGDLEVLCATCHQGHHIDEEKQAHGIYAKAVSSVLERERFSCMADLLEAVKAFCGRNKIPYDGAKVWRAVQLVDANRQGVVDAPKLKRHIPPPPHILNSTPVSQPEAASMLQSLGFKANLHRMPPPLNLRLSDVLRTRAMDQVGRLMLESLKRCEELEKAIEP